MRDQPGHVLRVNELRSVLQMVAAGRQPQGKARSAAAQPFSPIAFSAGKTTKRLQLIVMRSGAGIWVGTKNVSLTTTQTVSPGLNGLVSLLLVERVVQA